MTEEAMQAAAGLGIDAHADAGEFAPARHEHLLRDDPARYSELVSTVSSYGIYMMDADGYILSWNSGATKITGFTEREVLGRPQAFAAGDPAGEHGFLQRALHFARLNGHCREIQSRLRRDGKRYFAQVTLDVVRDAAGTITGFVEVFSDRDAVLAITRRSTTFGAFIDELVHVFDS